MVNLQRLRMTRKIFTSALGLASLASGAGVTSHSNLLASLNNHYSHNVNTNLLGRRKTAKAEEKNKIVAATKKCAAVLDPWIPEEIKSSFHVLQRVTTKP
ncbi:hypothetical protein YC2023_065638 [Brassica napus]